MVIKRKHTDTRPGKYTSCTQFLFELSKRWPVRVILYILIFLIVVTYLYQELVVYPLRVIEQLNVPADCFIWGTFRRGVRTAYFLCYVMLTIFYFMELAWCWICGLNEIYDMRLVKASKHIRFGFIVVAVILLCFLPALLKGSI